MAYCWAFFLGECGMDIWSGIAVWEFKDDFCCV